MKTKIFALLVLGIMYFNNPPCYSQNILTDGDFSATTVITSYTSGVGPANVWCNWQNPGTDATAAIISGECNYQVINGGYDLPEVQLIQGGFQLVQGDYYRLTFDVKADADRWFGVFLGEDGGSWTNIMGYENYYQFASTGWQTISIEFNASYVFAFHKLSFEIGGFNTGMYFDNVSLENIGPYPNVGAIGTALNGWYVDVDMATADGITYSLSNYPLNLGTMKFRQNNAWFINWGGYTFPTGTGFQDGPDIPIISASNYDITFNRLTGEYAFVCASNCHTAIGILGDAVSPDYNWESDVNMSTADGITYTLPAHVFAGGEAKFRQDDSWDINWGGTGFPSGTASPGGPNIPVTGGNYKVTFNIVTGDYNFTPPEIGIIGSALSGWMDDIDMQTTDGIIYTLSDYPFAAGEVKFRQDNSWDYNWGNYTFPAGYGYPGGPNIPVLAGNYDVTFNALTGEYVFTATDCPEAGIVCSQDIYTGNSSGICGAYVYYPDVVAAPNCGGEGITITQTEGLPSGALFPIGSTTNTFILTNASGNTAQCSFNVVVYDAEGPAIDNLNASIESQWPPNHKKIMVDIDYILTDNCGGSTGSQLYVYSSEPENGIGDGNTDQDCEVIDEHHILLRAERAGSGAGREYYIYVTAWDESWNYSWQQIIVTIPHDRSGFDKGSVEIKGANMTQPAKDVEPPLMARIWPNPGDQYFNLEVRTSSDKSIDLYIYDNSGRLISVQKVTDKHSFRFGDDLNTGVYYAKIQQGDHSVTIKVIKQ